VQWKILVNAAEASDEMILERPDGSFSGVATVNAGWDELVVNTLIGHELFERIRTFVVEALEARAKASFAELGVHDLVGGEDGSAGSGLKWLSKDAITVVVI